MKKGYEKQIPDLNVEKFSLMVRDNLNIFFLIKISHQVKYNSALQINSVSSAKKIIKDLKQHFGKDERQKLQYKCLSINYQCQVEIVVNKVGVPKLMDALAVFIKQERDKVKRIKNIPIKHHKDNNSRWASLYPIQIYSFIAM